MAAPAFGTAGTQLQGSASTMNVDVPDSVAVGDIIVVTAFVDGAVTVTGQPSGFAHAPDSPTEVIPVGGGRHSINVMWKRATAADSTAGTYDFTLSASTYRNAQAIRYTGAVTSGGPWDVTNSATGDVNDTTSPAVSDTTTVDDTLLVWASTNWSGGTWTPPTGFTERRDSGDGVCTVADKAQTSAGATGSITGTCTGSDRRTAWLGALKPSTGITKVADRGTAQNLTGETSTAVDLAAGASIEVGSYLIARVSADNAGSAGAAVTLTVSDTPGNTWTVLGPANADPGAANAGQTCWICYAKVTTGYANGDDVTFSYNGTSVTAKAIVVEEWANIHATSPVAVAATTATGASATPSISRTPTAAGQMFYGALGIEGPSGDTYTQDSDTTDGSWASLTSLSTTSGTATSNATTRGAYKLVTGTTAQTWDPAITSRDWAQVAVVFDVATGDATVQPQAIAVTAALPQAAVNVAAAPTVIPVVVALPQATPDTGGGNATATPDVFSAVAALPQPAVNIAAAPVAVAVTVTLPAAAVNVAAAPTVIPVLVTLPAATPDVGAGNATAQPAAIPVVVTLPASAESVGAAPTVIPVTVALPAAGVGVTAPATTIPVTVTLPQATKNIAAGPAAIPVTVTLPPGVVGVGAAPAAIPVTVAFHVPDVGVFFNAASVAAVSAAVASAAAVSARRTSAGTTAASVSSSATVSDG